MERGGNLSDIASKTAMSKEMDSSEIDTSFFRHSVDTNRILNA
jgi:hypothetical protein